MGYKLLWRLIIDQKEWWKSSITKKYNLVPEKDAWILSEKVILVQKFGNFFEPQFPSLKSISHGILEMENSSGYGKI
jgi:hypothetical protein